MSTGAALPPGADAILQSELAVERDGGVAPERALAPGTHVRLQGEDLRAGDELAPAGAVLTLPRVSALASAGVGEVGVHRRPRLDVIVTGSELLPVGAPPEPGRIHESNGLMIRLLAARAGAQVVEHGVVGDDRAATDEAVAAGLGGDVLVVSGGVSVGPHDHVRPAFEAAGVEEVFWRVRVKPGKPLWFGRRGDDARVRAAGQPAVDDRGLLRVHRARAAAAAGRGGRAAAARAGPPDGARAGLRRAHDVPHGGAAAGRRRRARGDADRAPGLAHDRRPGRERRVRGRAGRGRRATRGRRRSTCCGSGSSPSSRRASPLPGRTSSASSL